MKYYGGHAHGIEFRVAPFTGAWIEIWCATRRRTGTGSLPSRERGLKSARRGRPAAPAHVAPFTGAWIEIDYRFADVTHAKSLPSRERGLKCRKHELRGRHHKVAPFTGAWIEIGSEQRGYGCPEQSLPSRERGLKW